jgi:outer membrane protein
MKRLTMGIAALAVGMGFAQAASAGDYNGNFMVRLQGTYLVTQDKLKSADLNGVPIKDSLGLSADVSDVVLPTATLTYFLNKNLAVELLCCFSKHNVDLTSTGAPGLSGKIASAWIFPPALTLQYHFDGLGAFKPYVGAGAQWIHYFHESTSDNKLTASGVNFSDSFGPIIQAGFDYQLGGGWYLNADIKKSWLSTKLTFDDALGGAGNKIHAKADLDPLVISAGIGYRFNLEDLFGRRSAPAPLK